MYVSNYCHSVSLTSVTLTNNVNTIDAVGRKRAETTLPAPPTSPAPPLTSWGFPRTPRTLRARPRPAPTLCSGRPIKSCHVASSSSAHTGISSKERILSSIESSHFYQEVGKSYHPPCGHQLAEDKQVYWGKGCVTVFDLDNCVGSQQS